MNIRPPKRRLSEIITSLGGLPLVINTLAGLFFILATIRARSLPFPKEAVIALLFVAMMAPILANTKSANTSWLEFSEDIIISRRPLNQRFGVGFLCLFLVLFFLYLSRLPGLPSAFVIMLWVLAIIPTSIMFGYILCDRQITLDLLRRTYRYRLSFLVLLKAREKSLDEIAGIKVKDASYNTDTPPFYVLIQWKAPSQGETLLALDRNKEEISGQAQKVASLLDVPFTPATGYGRR